MSNYEVFADDFLTKCGIQFSTTFKNHGYHFHGDKQKRDRFIVTFRRNGAEMKITFGQSIAESTGYGSTPPRSYDVLAAIQKNDPGSFDNFCDEFGVEHTDEYGNFSAYKQATNRMLYEGVVAEYEKVKAFFSEQEMQEVLEIN